MLLTLLILVGGTYSIVWADEKAELNLQKQVIQERIEKFVVQNQLIQILFERAKQDLTAVEQRLKAIEEKEKVSKKPEVPK